jgi:Cu/Ag efflux protein CusF
MKTINLFAAALLALASAHASAEGMSGMAMPAKPAASATALPFVQGEVQKVDASNGVIVLRHADIPNLSMPAMTMGYAVADKSLLTGLRAGDKVQFQANMVKSKATVTALRRVN